MILKFVFFQIILCVNKEDEDPKEFKSIREIEESKNY